MWSNKKISWFFLAFISSLFFGPALLLHSSDHQFVLACRLYYHYFWTDQYFCANHNIPPKICLIKLGSWDNCTDISLLFYGQHMAIYCVLWLNFWLGLTWLDFHDLTRGDFDVFVTWFDYIWLKNYVFEIVMAWLFFILYFTILIIIIFTFSAITEK